MSKFKLALGLHNHQPVGNFDHVFEDAHSRAYMPFLQLFEKFSNIRLSLHQSGILWEWQEKHHPGYIEEVNKLVKAGRIELLTGGYYEPILPSIPDRDKTGQIDMLNGFLQSRFDTHPTGLWLTERVWEPHLPKILNEAGVRYLPVDDTHFLYAGFDPEDLQGVFITEESGVTLKLLPIQKKLRYLIPFSDVDKVIDNLKQQAEQNPDGLAVYADDGEKFGVWPNTHEHCYIDGWLDQFFTALADNSDWLEVITLGEAADTKPAGRAYLPSASYAEMLHWALPPSAFVEYEDLEKWLEENNRLEQYGRFIRGSHWRGFLTKYDEANLMHKRMLLVSDKLEEYEREFPEDTETIDHARRHLYAGQCNCPYWHGVFGGLYLPHLRQAIYENLIKSEKYIIRNTDEVLKTITDFDCDGNDEVIIDTDKFKAVFAPRNGGQLIELDSIESEFNLTDTLRRRREGYHEKLATARFVGDAAEEEKDETDETASIHDIVWTKEKDLDKQLTNDWYSRRCFIDHFFNWETDLEKFKTGQLGDEGDFVLEPYEIIRNEKESKVTLRREGQLWRHDGAKRLSLQKEFYFKPGSDVFSVNYFIVAEDEGIPNVRLAIENNFNFQAGHADDRYILFDGVRKEDSFLDSAISQNGCNSIIVRDDWRNLAVALAFDKCPDVWQAPIHTISLSEGGFEKVYQGTSLMSVFTVDLEKGVPFETTILVFAGKPDNMPPRFFRECPRIIEKVL